MMVIVSNNDNRAHSSVITLVEIYSLLCYCNWRKKILSRMKNI